MVFPVIPRIVGLGSPLHVTIVSSSLWTTPWEMFDASGNGLRAELTSLETLNIGRGEFAGEVGVLAKATANTGPLVPVDQSSLDRGL